MTPPLTPNPAPTAAQKRRNLETVLVLRAWVPKRREELSEGKRTRGYYCAGCEGKR